MYGGDSPDHASAQLAAGRELTAIQAVLGLKIPKLQVPLMAVIDFRGSRLTAQALVPIGTSTLCYGSADAGRTLVSSPVPSIVVEISKKLHLAEHPVFSVSGQRHQLWMPADVEVHQPDASSDTFYLIDLAR